jgi:hypothetical protein
MVVASLKVSHTIHMAIQVDSNGHTLFCQMVLFAIISLALFHNRIKLVLLLSYEINKCV